MSLKNKVLIVVPDRTRNAHIRETLPLLLRKLSGEGVDPREIEILIGLGLHEPMDRPQLTEMLGPAIMDKYKVSNHSLKPGSLAYLGKTKKGVPIYLNKKLLSAKQIMTLGIVEPHLYAGYSGGIKAIAIGLAGDKTISYTHHPRFLDNKGTALGHVETNLFNKTLWEMVSSLPVTYSVNVVNDRHGKISRIFSGRPGEAYKKAVTYADKLYRRKVPRVYDVVIASIGKQKGANFYQASRAYNYLLGVAHPIVKPGGYVIVDADLPDGFGRGLGEQRFGEILKKVRRADKFIARIKKGGCKAGEHRAYMVAKALLRANLALVSPRAPQLLAGTCVAGFTSLPRALAEIAGELGKNPSVFRTAEVFNAIYSKGRP